MVLIICHDHTIPMRDCGGRDEDVHVRNWLSAFLEVGRHFRGQPCRFRIERQHTERLAQAPDPDGFCLRVRSPADPSPKFENHVRGDEQVPLGPDEGLNLAGSEAIPP